MPGLEDGGEEAKEGIMANLKAFDFHSTMRSSEISPSQTPALSSKGESTIISEDEAVRTNGLSLCRASYEWGWRRPPKGGYKA